MKNKTKKQNRAKFGKYVKPYLPFFILGPLCMIVEVIGEVVMPKIFSIVINRGMEADGYEPLTSSASLLYMGLMILVAVTMMAGGIGGAYFGTKAAVGFSSDLRSDMYSRVQRYSFANIDKFSTGSLVTRLTNDVTQLQNFIAMLLRMALRAPGMIIAGIIMAVSLSPSLSLVLCVSVPLVLLSVGGIILIGFKRFATMQKKVDGLNTAVQENITNVRVVKSFVREDHEIDKFHVANRNLKEAGMGAMRVMIFMGPVLNFFMNATVLAVIWFGGKIVYNGDMPIGDLSAFITYVNQILFSLMAITFLLMMSARALASARRIREVLEEEPDISDKDAKQRDLKIKEGDIEFRNVSFKYFKTSEGQVLDGVSLHIKGGDTVGIIGSTGSGKSTLISLIPRLYDADFGEVLVDGVNVKDYSLYNLRDGISTVLQNNTLFSGSIAENLRWGDENASDAEIEEAAKKAQAHSFITSFEGAYNYGITKGGTNVSGGQRQRLCIARALLKRPKIIILDDSTSAVDTATEAMIRSAFQNELKDCTKIIIAQRISSVKDADMIVVMNDGKITAVGNHDELIEKSEEYKEIYTSQIDGKEAAN